MIRRILTLLLLAFCLNIFADRIDDVIQNIAGLDKYQDASAINVLTEIDLEVMYDFSYNYHVFYVKKILNYKGKKRYSDVKISYNADYETIKLGHCFTIDTEGNRIEIPENQIYDMNDTESIQSPDYKNFREKIINFPQIEPGYFVVLDYTITNTRREPVSGVEHLRESNPYLEKTFSITFPIKMKLKSFYDKDIVRFSKQKQGGHNTYSWNVTDTKIYKEENNSPSLLLSGTPIVYSFYKDWHELADAKLAKLKNIDINPEISEAVKSITENRNNEKEKILAIYKYMADNFNEKESYISQIDFTPEPLSEVWQKKFGSEKKLTAMFIAMANSAGIDDVYPAVILDSNDRFSEIQENYAVANFMDRICVYWEGNLYCPGNSFIPFTFAGNVESNVLIGNDKYEFIQYKARTTPDEEYLYNYLIDGNSARVKIEAHYSGAMNQKKREWYLNMPDSQRKIWFNRSLGERSASLTEGPNFLNFDQIEEDLRVNYTLEYDGFLVEQKPYKYFKLIASSFNIDVALDERDNDYQIADEIFLKQQFIINFENSENLQLLNKIQNITEFMINESKAYFSLETELKGSKLIVNKEIYIPEGVISNSDYKEFKQFILSIKNPINDMVFIK